MLEDRIKRKVYFLKPRNAEIEMINLNTHNTYDGFEVLDDNRLKINDYINLYNYYSSIITKELKQGIKNIYKTI